MGKLRVYFLKTLNKLSIYPLGNTPSAPSDWGRPGTGYGHLLVVEEQMLRRVDSPEASGSGTVSEDELLELKRTRRAVFRGRVVDESENKDEEVHAGGSEDGDEDDIEGGDDGGDHPEVSSKEDDVRTWYFYYFIFDQFCDPSSRTFPFYPTNDSFMTLTITRFTSINEFIVESIDCGWD